MGLYLLTAVALTGMAPLQDFNKDTAMADAFASVDLNFVSFIIYFCAFFGITAACFTNLLVSKLSLGAESSSNSLVLLFSFHRRIPKACKRKLKMVLCHKSLAG